MPDYVRHLRPLCTAPTDATDFDRWLKCEDALSFLRDNAKRDDLILYASFPHLFIHVIGVPATRVSPPEPDDLLSWSITVGDSWGVSYGFTPPDAKLEPPLSNTGTRALEHGTKFVFARSFEGRTEEPEYMEILQEFAHAFDLHFVPERKAYCRFDERGDLDDIVRIFDVPQSGGFGGTLVLCRRRVLDEWMTITGSALVQTFDVTRFRESSFFGWGEMDRTREITGDMLYESALQPGYGSYLRGVQIIRSSLTKEELVARAFGRKEREYASFIALDWKNDVVTEISTAPGATANYFTESPLAYETSHVFFRPEVLHKYKADSDKYTLKERSISCRGAWHLETYDINEQGQVHTYLVYLRRLPYEEQLHWKAYNEAPKGPISERARRTDFEGSWNLDYDPLPSLRALLEQWDRKRVPWWRLRNAKLLEQVQYPATSAADEWGAELMRLDQLLVEGFEEKWLRQKAKTLGREPGSTLRSLKLLEECLMGLGCDEERAKSITAPLHRVHDLRSQIKGHASG